MKRLLLSLFIFLSMVVPVLGQDEECQAEAAAALVRGFADQIESGEHDVADLIDVLLALQAGCMELSWNSDDEGMQPVIGPVALEDGLYKVGVITDGYMIAEIDVLNGECEGGSYGTLFGIMAGQAEDGAETLLKASDECELMISISNTNEPWAMAIEKLR